MGGGARDIGSRRRGLAPRRPSAAISAGYSNSPLRRALVLFLHPSPAPAGMAGYRARRRALKKAARAPAREAKERDRQAKRKAKDADAAARTPRRELEDAYVKTFMEGPMPAHAAGNPSFAAFVRSRARSMPDESLRAYVNLARGDDDDDDAAMRRDMDLLMSDMRGK